MKRFNMLTFSPNMEDFIAKVSISSRHVRFTFSDEHFVTWHKGIATDLLFPNDSFVLILVV
jgi:hypothetical protein